MRDGGSRQHPGEGVRARRVWTPRAERGEGLFILTLHWGGAPFPGAKHREKPSVTLAVGTPFPGSYWDEGSREFPSEIPTALVQVHVLSHLAPGTFSSRPGISLVLFLDTPCPQERAILGDVPQPPGDLPVRVSSCPTARGGHRGKAAAGTRQPPRGNLRGQTEVVLFKTYT